MEVEQQDELAEFLINSLKRKEVKKTLKALEMGGDPNYIGPEGFAAIHLAAGLDGCRGEELLKMVLRYSANPNLKSLDGETALHVAVMWNRESSTKILLAHGADPTIKNIDGLTAFQLAANSSDHELKCFELLKSSYMDDSSENEMPMSFLSKSRSPRISPTSKEASKLYVSLSETEQMDSLDELFTWDSDDSSTSYFSLPKHSLKGLITELKEGEERHILHKVTSGEASLIVGSDFEPRISIGEIPLSLIKHTNETILLDQLKRRSNKHSFDKLLQRKKKLLQKHEQKFLNRLPQSVSSTDDIREDITSNGPRLFKSPFPLNIVPEQDHQKQDHNEDSHRINKIVSASPGTPKKLFDAPMVRGKPTLIIPPNINSFSNTEPNTVHFRTLEPGGNMDTPQRSLQKSFFSFPYSSAGTSSSANDVTNRTPSNEENGSNSKPGSGNEETESEFPIMQRLHSPRNLYSDMTQNFGMVARSQNLVDQSTTMHSDVRGYAESTSNFNINDKPAQLNEIKLSIGQQSKNTRWKLGGSNQQDGADVFIVDNESPTAAESDGNSSGYSGDVSQFSSPDDVVGSDVVKFDLKNSPCVTIRNKSKKKDSSTDFSDEQDSSRLKLDKSLDPKQVMDSESTITQSPRKRLNAVTSSEEENTDVHSSKGKKFTFHASPRRTKSPSQRIRENVDCSFGDKSAVMSPLVADDLKSFHRAKLSKQHHVGNWKDNCQCELCMTKRASLPSSPALPHCEHDQCHNSKEFEEVTVEYDWKDVSLLESTDTEHALVVPDEMQALSIEELKQKLIKAGEFPGPITANTKNIYIKQLARIEAGIVKEDNDSVFVDYLPELRQELKMVSSNDFSNFEEEMSAEFENPPKHKWREGTQKTSFNYVLLDPRVTTNLIERAQNLTETEIFRCFVRSIFYVGKGKESRPYGHLYEAVKMKKLNDKGTKVSDKLKMILNIWQTGFGVVSLHLFHSIIPVEAYTREACMIEVLGLARLTNLKRGEFYGPASSWNSKKKRQLGIHLLKKALKIYLVEGEKQIREKDL